MKKIFQYAALATLPFITACELPEWSQGIVQSLIQGLIPIVLLLVSTLVVCLTTWIKSKTKTSSIQNIAIGLTEYVASVIQSLIEEEKVLLLEVLADGKIDDAETKKLRDKALDIVKRSIKPEMLSNIASSLGLTQEGAMKYLEDKVTGMLGAQTSNMVSSNLYNHDLSNKINSTNLNNVATATVLKKSSVKKASKNSKR